MGDSDIQTLTQQYNNTLSQYEQTYQDYISSLNNSPKDTDYSQYNSKLSDLNQSLIDTNQKISDIVNQSYTSYDKDSQKSQKQNQILQQNNNTLIDQKLDIEKLAKEYETINAASKETNLVVTQEYSKYIVLIFITILLILLLLKYSITGTEQVGGGSKFINEAIFLLILIVVSIGLAPVVNNLNAYVFITLVIISYIVIKMKIINNN
jgi:hypothetical protein